MSVTALRPSTIATEHGERRLSLKNQHRIKLAQVQAEAERLADCARRIAHMAEEVLSRGGVLVIQPQMNFLTGALARLYKDWAVAENLQSLHQVKGDGK